VALAIVSTIRKIRRRLAPDGLSLAARLILAAAVWLSAGMAVGACVLSHAFSTAVADNFDTALQVDLDGLIAAAEPDETGAIALQERFLNRRFARVYSGLYWQIAPDGKGEPLISRSLFDTSIKIENRKTANGLIWGYADGPDGQHLRVLGRHVTFAALGAAGRGFTFLVAGDLSRVDAEIADFNDTLIRSFAVLGIGLILAIFIQVQVGLMPLRRVGEGRARIRSGAARRLEGTFPAEIAPLAKELNSLIEHSAEVVGRARTHVSNLAHFFKTPLSVLASEADAAPGPLAEAVKKQVEVMRRQVDHTLTRARTAGALDVLGNRTEVAEVLDALARALSRIHAARHLDIAVECPAGLGFRGERQDLEEMAGNLMDNACKWAKTQVHAAAVPVETGRFVLKIEDDGPGLSPADRARVLARGERLDESVPGSGLGLSIVRDIAKLYAGTLAFEESRWHGLAALLTLPSEG
jgi:signal transduction histidine kinase